jgi:hypothetical protein
MNVFKRLFQWQPHPRHYKKVVNAALEMKDFNARLTELTRQETDLVLERRRLNAQLDRLREERRRVVYHTASTVKSRWSEVVTREVERMRGQVIETMDLRKHDFEETQSRVLGLSKEDLKTRTRMQNFEKNQLTLEDCLFSLEFAYFLRELDIDIVIHNCNAFTGYARLWGEYDNAIGIPEPMIAHAFSVCKHAEYLSSILREIFRAFGTLPRVKTILFLTRTLPHNAEGRSIFIQLELQQDIDRGVNLKRIPSLWFSSFLEE